MARRRYRRVKRCLARAGAERRTRSERARAHAEARAERRGNVAEEVTAAGAAAIVSDGACSIRAEPMTASFALRIDTLHGKTGQILHFVSLSGQPALRIML
jgi:hypothetical protein